MWAIWVQADLRLVKVWLRGNTPTPNSLNGQGSDTACNKSKQLLRSWLICIPFKHDFTIRLIMLFHLIVGSGFTKSFPARDTSHQTHHNARCIAVWPSRGWHIFVNTIAIIQLGLVIYLFHDIKFQKAPKTTWGNNAIQTKFEDRTIFEKLEYDIVSTC
jgi:hypothetical protein